MPQTHTEFVNHEPSTPQHDAQSIGYQQQFVAMPPTQPQHQTGFNEDDGFTTPPDYNDGPLTMASSPPASETPVPQVPPPAPPQADSLPPQEQPPQQAPPSQNQQNSWISSLQKKVQQVIPGQNPMKLPDDKNPGISWDSAQNKWVGNGVEQEAVAPPPPTMQTAPAVQGGGIRAARGGLFDNYFKFSSPFLFQQLVTLKLVWEVLPMVLLFLPEWLHQCRCQRRLASCRHRLTTTPTRLIHSVVKRIRQFNSLRHSHLLKNNVLVGIQAYHCDIFYLLCHFPSHNFGDYSYTLVRFYQMLIH